jgi:hypothetical protein
VSSPDGRTCPSAPCAPGSALIGLVRSDGTIGYVRPALPVTDDFLERVRTGGTPGARFRFAAPCVEDGCVHWDEEGCGVIRTVLETVGASEDPAPLPRCAIRAACRWFAQEGRAACGACPLVLTSERRDG